MLLLFGLRVIPRLGPPHQNPLPLLGQLHRGEKSGPYPASPHHFRMATKLRNPPMFCVGSHHAGTSPPSSPPSAASSAAPSAAAASPVLPLLAACLGDPRLWDPGLLLDCLDLLGMASLTSGRRVAIRARTR